MRIEIETEILSPSLGFIEDGSAILKTQLLAFIGDRAASLGFNPLGSNPKINPSKITTMTAELETGLPSVRQIQTLIREEREVELKLTTNDLLTGKIRWQDPDCICLFDHYDQPTIVWRQAIVFVKPKA